MGGGTCFMAVRKPWPLLKPGSQYDLGRPCEARGREARGREGRRQGGRGREGEGERKARNKLGERGGGGGGCGARACTCPGADLAGKARVRSVEGIGGGRDGCGGLGGCR